MQNNHCQPHEIESFLTDAMDPKDESKLLSHIEVCATCRDSLEQTAADVSTWQSATSFLSDAEHDSILLSGLRDLDSAARFPEMQAEEDATAAQVQSVLSILAPTDDPQMFGRLGPYEISGVVGAGGMGVVMKGHDLALDRVVAIKVLAPHLATSGAARKRFAREAKAAAAVLHPNVMSIHSVDNEGALPFLVMPFMRGSSLQKRIDKQGPLSTVEILRVAGQIAAGLAAAHAQGLVHRDIKPANIMLADGLEQVAITDFGLARAVDDATMTRSGIIAGTPQYMSPEQARGLAIDSRSDLFSLGSLIYAMCTGHSPFRAESSFGVLRRITDDQPRAIEQINPQIPRWLCNLVDMLLAKQPADRIQTAREVETLVADCLAHVEQPTHNSLPDCLLKNKTKAGKPRKSVGIFISAAALILTLIAGLFNFPSLRTWITDPSDPTQEESVAKTGAQAVEDGAKFETLANAETSETVASELDQLLRESELDIEVMLSEIQPTVDSLEQIIQSTSPEGFESNEP